MSQTNLQMNKWRKDMNRKFCCLQKLLEPERNKNKIVGFRRAPVILLMLGLSSSAVAQDIKLTLQDSPLTILKDSTTTKKIVGVPEKVPGAIILKIKRHAMTLIPNTFNTLKIELKHGSNVKETRTCYSAHSDKTPRCSFWSFIFDQTEADASNWKLRITNNSNHDVNGFNILKAVTDLNPFVSSDIQSSFRPDCSPRNLSLVGKATISSHTTVEKALQGILSRAGEIHIRAKWHTASLTPNLFDPLKVELLREGTVVATDEGYSIHSAQKEGSRSSSTRAQRLNWKVGS